MEHKIFIKRKKKSTLCVNCISTIKRAVNMTLRYEKVDVPCVVSVLITDDEGIRDYNYEYRGLDEATDVLSFPMQTFRRAGWGGIYDPVFDERTGELPLGDIIISLETVRKHAMEYGNTVTHETAYMLVHSTLHLLGYDHTNESGEKKMHDKGNVVVHSL